MYEDLQPHVQDAVDQLVESGAERGLQVAVYRHGHLVVDAVAAVADPATGRAVTSDTPFLSYSIGKGVASTVVHVHAEHGVLTYDTRIVELWPELGAHGKDKATIRQALSLSAGVRGLPSGLTVEDLCDGEKMCAIIGAAELWWEPGTRSAITPSPGGTSSVRSSGGQPGSPSRRSCGRMPPSR